MRTKAHRRIPLRAGHPSPLSLYDGYCEDQGAYNYYFREGFRRGYEDGYYSRYQYGTYYNGEYSVLGAVLGQILNFAALR